jgi:hypothetical protein
MSIETEAEAAMDEFSAHEMVPIEPSPIELVEQMIARNEAHLERLTENVKQTRELLKRLRATLKVMRESTLG